MTKLDKMKRLLTEAIHQHDLWMMGRHIYHATPCGYKHVADIFSFAETVNHHAKSKAACAVFFVTMFAKENRYIKEKHNDKKEYTNASRDA